MRRGRSVRRSGSMGRGDRGNADQMKRAASRVQRLLSGKQAVRTEYKDCCRESRLSGQSTKIVARESRLSGQSTKIVAGKAGCPDRVQRLLPGKQAEQMSGLRRKRQLTLASPLC